MVNRIMEDEKVLPVDEYLQQSVGERMASSDDFDPFSDDEVVPPKSDLEKQMDMVSIECHVRGVHPLVLGALKYGRGR